LLKWLKDRMIGEGKILPEDLELLQVMDDPEQVVRYIQKFVIV